MKKLLSLCLLALIFSMGILGITNISKPKIIDKATAEKVVEYQTETNEVDSLELCVIGNAKKAVSPDSAKVTAVIETLDMDISKSKDSNFQILNEVISALSEVGIREECIVVDSFTCYPSYDYNAGKTLIGYYAITTFTFDVDNLDNLKSYVDVVTEKGVTSIRNINYQLSNLDEVYQDVLLMAIDNAKEKAIKVTGKEGITVKGIKEEYVYSCSTLYRDYAETLESSAFIGSIEVEAKVVVNFEI